MTTIVTYNPNDYRSRNWGLDANNALIKASIRTNINRVSRTLHEVQVDDNSASSAKEVYKKFKERKDAERKQFLAGIKVTFSGQFNVDSLYARLKRIFQTDIHLPDTWRGGKSIQNWNQNDFWSFSFCSIKGSNSLDGNHVIVTTLSERKVWFLPTDFQSRISGLMEDYRMEGKHITRMDDLLDAMAIRTFDGQEWKENIKDKKVFILSKR